MQRTPLVLALALGTCLASSAVDAATGVAFIHGTGQQTNALADYWTSPFVDSVKQGLADPANVLVINCDLTRYMWDPSAAGCVAGQLQGFIRSRAITDLVVISHSNGGNVIRWILSNPTYDSRYPEIIGKIRRVEALAPSSAGTPLADAAIAGNAFETSLGWLLGYQNDAVRMQQVSWMATYNANNLYGTAGRPALPRPFRNVVGSDVSSAPFTQGATCGGYGQSVGLEFTQNWLASCSDGFLECSSQAAAGTTWFRDTQRTSSGRVLNHNQSRRNCFGLDVILRNDL